VGLDTDLGRANVAVRATLEKLDGDLEGARGKVDSAISKIVDGAGKNFQALGVAALSGIGAATGAVAGLGAALAKVTIDAAPVEGVSDAFAGLAESAGQGADGMLDALKRGSAGMIANRDLMMSFNQAAQLVSTDFAVQLPDAMGYLSKVAAATGQDMGFMLDSLVKGVGRVSPMILDNLGIQVNLTEAAAEWAKTSGRAAIVTTDNSEAMGELGTKLEFAEREYALMVDRQKAAIKAGKDTGSINLQMDKKAAQIAEYRAELENLEATHGSTTEDFDALIESMTKAEQQEAVMAMTMKKLAENTAAMPDVTETAAAKMAQFKATIQDTKDQVGVAFLPVLNNLMGVVGHLAEKVLPPLTDFIETTLAPAFETASLFIDEFMAGILAGNDPLTALQATLREFGLEQVAEAIGTVVAKGQELWAVVGPWIEKAAEWIGQNVELKDVLIALGAAIATVVLPVLWSIITAVAPIIAVFIAAVAIVVALRKAWESDFLGLRTFILDTLEKITTWWAEHGDAIMAKAREIWEAVVAVFEWFKGIFTGIFDAFRLAFEGDWYGFGEKLREVWNEIWSKIAEIQYEVWEKIKSFFQETDWGAVGRNILEGVARGIATGVYIIEQAARDAARAALEAAMGFLGIHSASREAMQQIGLPFVQGIGAGMEYALPSLVATAENTSARMLAAGSVEAMNAGAVGGPGGYQINNYFGADSVRSEEDIYRLTEEIDRSLSLRGLQKVVV
jgi:phage-related protein